MAPRRSLVLLPLALAAGGAAAQEATRRPPCRKSPEFHSLTWPDGSNRVVAFGGKGYSWENGKSGLKAKVQMFGDTWGFDAGDFSWSALGHADEPSPSSRWKPSSCTTDDDHTLVLFGGDHITNISGVLQDLWVFRTDKGPGLGSWKQVETLNTPRNRRGHILEANSTHLLVMGGKTYVPGTDGVVLTDVWTIPKEALDSSNGKLAWTRGADFPGEPRWGATGTVMKDANGDEVLAVFGGRHLNAGAGFHSVDANAYTYYNELWIYSFKENKWTKPEIKGSQPHVRDHHGASELNGDLWVFGGRVSEERSRAAVLNDLWSFSLSSMSWTLHRVSGDVSPTARYMPGVAGTTLQGKPAIAVFAGETLPGSTKQTSMNDLWYYLPTGENTGSWSQVLNSDCSAAAVAPAAKATSLAAGGEISEAEALAVAAAPFLLGAVTIGAFAASLALQLKDREAAAAEVDAERPHYIAIE